MKQFLVVLLAFLFLTNTLVMGQQRSRARVKRKAVATPCDRVAAHPEDPTATTKGISDANIDASAVITACEAEADGDNVSPRITFQLARGYLKAGRIEDGVAQLIVAAKGGHGGALAYLGDFYLDGSAGLEADPVLAHSLYQRAAEAGFSPAKTVLAQFEDVTDSAASETTSVSVNKKYINPEIVDNIFKGDLDAVPYGELYTKAYLSHMADNISGLCEGAHFTSREVQMLKLDAVEKSVEMTAEAGLTTLMGALMGMAQMVQNPAAFIRQQAEAGIDQDQLPDEAMKDSFTLIQRYRCGSRELGQFSKNLVSYIRNDGAPRMSTEEMYSRCQREARPTGRYDAKNFCMCFVSAMSQAGVSRANRKGLSVDFWGTAQRMMAQRPQHYSMCDR